MAPFLVQLGCYLVSAVVIFSVERLNQGIKSVKYCLFLRFLRFDCDFCLSCGGG